MLRATSCDGYEFYSTYESHKSWVVYTTCGTTQPSVEISQEFVCTKITRLFHISKPVYVHVLYRVSRFERDEEREIERVRGIETKKMTIKKK